MPRFPKFANPFSGSMSPVGSSMALAVLLAVLCVSVHLLGLLTRAAAADLGARLFVYAFLLWSALYFAVHLRTPRVGVVGALAFGGAALACALGLVHTLSNPELERIAAERVADHPLLLAYTALRLIAFAAELLFVLLLLGPWTAGTPWPARSAGLSSGFVFIAGGCVAFVIAWLLVGDGARGPVRTTRAGLLVLPAASALVLARYSAGRPAALALALIFGARLWSARLSGFGENFHAAWSAPLEWYGLSLLGLSLVGGARERSTEPVQESAGIDGPSS